MPLEIKHIGFGLLCFLLMLITIQNIGTNESATFEALEREFDAKPVAAVSKPDPLMKLRSAIDGLATSVASVAIQVSLIPRDLLDREAMERQIQGQFENWLGDGWSVEVICYVGWCNIQLKHEIGEVVIDAHDGSATKSVYLK